MKFIVSTFLTAFLAYAVGLFAFLPWYFFSVAAMSVGIIIPQKSWKAFVAGFLGMFLLWAILGLWINYRNDGILATAVAKILPLNGSPYLLVLFTGIVGGLIGGFAALTGHYFRRK